MSEEKEVIYEAHVVEVKHRLMQFRAKNDDEAKEIIRTAVLTNDDFDIKVEDSAKRYEVLSLDANDEEDDAFAMYMGDPFPGADWFGLKKEDEK